MEARPEPPASIKSSKHDQDNSPKEYSSGTAFFSSFLIFLVTIHYQTKRSSTPACVRRAPPMGEVVRSAGV